MTKTLVHTFSALLGIAGAAAVIVLMAVVVTTVLSSGTLGSPDGPDRYEAGGGRVDSRSGPAAGVADPEVAVPTRAAGREGRPE